MIQDFYSSTFVKFVISTYQDAYTCLTIVGHNFRACTKIIPLKISGCSLDYCFRGRGQVCLWLCQHYLIPAIQRRFRGRFQIWRAHWRFSATPTLGYLVRWNTCFPWKLPVFGDYARVYIFWSINLLWFEFYFTKILKQMLVYTRVIYCTIAYHTYNTSYILF